MKISNLNLIHVSKLEELHLYVFNTHILLIPSMLEELYSKQPMLKEVFGELYNMKKLLGKAKK